MNFRLRAPLYGVLVAMMASTATPSDAGALSLVDTSSHLGVSSALVQNAAHTTAGKKCIKWTRRWNTRHGVGHRRCVQWK